MKRQIIINTNSLIKSEMFPDIYFLLQIIFEKDTDLFNVFKDKLWMQQGLDLLESAGYIKFTGEGLEESLLSPESLDILDFVLLEKATKLFVNDKVTEAIHEVDEWIGEYRNLFKGIKIGSLGDPNACLKKMKLFLKTNPQYTKEQIFEATKAYIKNTEPRYTMQADYFISKTGNDKIATSKLASWLEQINVIGEVVDKSSLNKMV